MLAEGLNKIPLDDISKKIVSLGFNCVRLTWPVAFATNGSLFSLTVENSFKNLGLNQALAGIEKYNPNFPKLTIVRAYQEVVMNLEKNNVMVILDNHISKPGWCCNINDGNGFFGDTYFDPELWRLGLANMAAMFKDQKNVVGMSLRNELRGHHENAQIWEGYIREGTAIIANINPNALVIISGLHFDLDLSALHIPLAHVADRNKLLFEIHQYGVSFGDGWESSNPNDFCGKFKKTFHDTAGFVMDRYPLFLSEFGGDLRGTNKNDNRFLNCMFGVIAELDLDWSLWSLQGSYYLREGTVDMEEMYGVLDKDWNQIRSPSFMERIHAIQPQHQGPSNISKGPYKIIFHPTSGLCINETYKFDPIRLAPCNGAEKWDYTPDKAIMLKDSLFGLQAVAMGKAPELDIDCDIRPNAKWEMISASGMHLSTNLPNNGDRVCLDVNQNGVLVTNSCICLKGDSSCDPSSQWFKIIELQLYEKK
ncbi:hypothetical protein AQUCO_01100423v1 [Aquilegia coerulea]|uniref:Glycoside hydrolase family 5 domain-containing protein n=1 Tax=Aquilegia coerulea TaxID=218851 RepID=A0A2G5E704_AQUCA|nr:hypothetical protein AQUCO_01100423v1 [Aquilegia coerulea]